MELSVHPHTKTKCHTQRQLGLLISFLCLAVIVSVRNGHELLPTSLLEASTSADTLASFFVYPTSDTSVINVISTGAKSNQLESPSNTNNHSYSQNNSVSKEHQMISLTSSTSKEGDLFEPGTLNMTRTEAFRRCYVDPHIYGKHMRSGRNQCVISDKFRIAYFMVGKAGSSTCRTVMHQHFQGSGSHCTPGFSRQHAKKGRGNLYQFSVVRDPISRFISAYQEMLVRWNIEKRRQIPPTYEPFLVPYRNKSKTFLQTMPRTEDGMRRLTQMFEHFVEVYDAETPFDGHIRLEVPRLTNPRTGKTLALDEIFDSRDLQSVFNTLANITGAPTMLDVPKVYSRGLKFVNSTWLSDATKRKICQLNALDFCCLNYPLPPECRNDDANMSSSSDVVTSTNVQCRWISKPKVSKSLLIEAVSPFPARGKPK